MQTRSIERHAALGRPLGLPLGLAMLGAAVLTGCRGGTYRITLEMARSNEAKVTVLGSRPNVRIDNKGPGDVRIAYDEPPDTVQIELEPEAHATLRSDDGETLTLTTGEEAGAEVRITATHATGIAVDQAPVPK